MRYGASIANALLLLAVCAAPARGQAVPLGAENRDSLYLDAARTAYRFIEANTDANTGLIAATAHYPNATTWDIGSGIAATYSAWRLGLVDDTTYRARIDRMLETIETLPLYDSAAYHKVYSVRQATMVTGDGVASRTGYAWSATDLGRFLVWLKILERGDTASAPAARRIAERMRFDRIVRDGYMYGEDRHRRVPAFQEGRIGYEQYAASGFDLWRQTPAHALDMSLHAEPVDVWGRQLLRDERGLDRLSSEPFVMIGLELGLAGEMLRLAEEVLALQRTRWQRTGIVTIASEDAVNVPPNYFYYYCVYCSGRAFVIETHTPGDTRDRPRWVSTKATFGWHALMPDEYTKLAMHTVRPAADSGGWYSGIFEQSTQTTGVQDINTAAVVLEAALYVVGGGPILCRAAADMPLPPSYCGASEPGPGAASHLPRSAEAAVP